MGCPGNKKTPVPIYNEVHYRTKICRRPSQFVSLSIQPNVKYLVHMILFANYLAICSYFTWRSFLIIAVHLQQGGLPVLLDLLKAHLFVLWSIILIKQQVTAKTASWICSPYTGPYRSWRVLMSWAMAMYSTLPTTHTLRSTYPKLTSFKQESSGWKLLVCPSQ